MLDNEFIEPSDLRAAFSSAMSAMYRDEVPAYGTLVDLVAEVNDKTIETNPELAKALEITDGLDRISDERHGAIRLGTEQELKLIRRAFALMGMLPVGYYDLSVAGIPVHSTAFRPIDGEALSKNPFRVFTSLLRLDLIADNELKADAEAVLEDREIFATEAVKLIAEAEQEGGVQHVKSDQFIQEILKTFKWHPKANVSKELYDRLHEAHRLIADVVSFKGPHINHLTPRTLNIDQVQKLMPERSINPKAVVEGPPSRNCPILLRQTSFKALEESVDFTDMKDGKHTARFGEIEQRGAALTPKGRALYDELLNRTRAKCTPAADGSNAEEYVKILEETFSEFPDNWVDIRAQNLAYFNYSLSEDGNTEANCGGSDLSFEELCEDGLIRFDPITYEDFLPVSAAGIFQSNLGDKKAADIVQNSNQELFEKQLGAKVLNEFTHYAELEAKSKAKCLKLLKPCAKVMLIDFETLKAEGLIIDDQSEMQAYELGARFEQGHAAFVMRPKTTEDVSKLVTYCVRNNITITPQSGNTGLVSASVPDKSGEQAILSLEKVKSNFEVNFHNRSVTVGAGMRLSELNTRLEKHNLSFPIDLGADPMIGGMVATNTGGARFIRYGDVRQNILGLTAVLPDENGTVLNFKSSLRKNNTGCDWKQLFVGTSGAFGIVTECVLNLHPLPAQSAAAIVIPSSAESIFELLVQLESRLGNQLSAFEFMSRQAMLYAFEHSSSLRNPFENGDIPELALLVEISRSWNPIEGELSTDEFLQLSLAAIWETDSAPIADALFGDTADIWSIRHTLSEGAKYAGTLFAFDLSFERQIVMQFRESITGMIKNFDHNLEICDFGHIGDGGLHLNLVLPKEYQAQDLVEYELKLRDMVVSHAVEVFGGSYSAEHALGPKNQKFYDRYATDGEKAMADRFIEMMRINKCGQVNLGHTH